MPGPEAPDLAVSRRRQLSILVCDLVGATQNSQAVDPEDMGGLAAGFRRSAVDVAVEVGGYVAPTSVDVVHIYFGYPTTHEDDAVQAVRAGMALVDFVAGMGAMVEAGITARAGIATGHRGGRKRTLRKSAARPVAIGEAPARAGGMLALAAPGQVVVSRHTRLLLGQHFDLCAVDVSGPGQRADRPEAWHVRGERDPVSRRAVGTRVGLAPLMGRQEEFDLLLRRWDQARQGTGRVVLVSGEPASASHALPKTCCESWTWTGQNSFVISALAITAFGRCIPLSVILNGV